MVVRAVVEEIKKQLEQKIRQAVLAALDRKEHSPLPNASAIDWKWTIGRNLKNYNPELRHHHPRAGLLLFARRSVATSGPSSSDMDQSGSMADSVVYGGRLRLDLRQPAGAGDARRRLRHRGGRPHREMRQRPGGHALRRPARRRHRHQQVGRLLRAVHRGTRSGRCSS